MGARTSTEEADVLNACSWKVSHIESDVLVVARFIQWKPLKELFKRTTIPGNINEVELEHAFITISGP